MKCPRREGISSVFKLPEVDQWREDDTCSFCGSLNPDTFMARLESGDVEIDPTDKSYKIYVKNLGGSKFKQSYRKCPVDSTCKGPDSCSHWATEERSETKFYFQHLSEEQKMRFIEIYNEKKMKIGNPGYFYVTPFFCSKGK